MGYVLRTNSNRAVDVLAADILRIQPVGCQRGIIQCQDVWNCRLVLVCNTGKRVYVLKNASNHRPMDLLDRSVEKDRHTCGPAYGIRLAHTVVGPWMPCCVERQHGVYALLLQLVDEPVEAPHALRIQSVCTCSGGEDRNRWGGSVVEPCKSNHVHAKRTQTSGR